MTNESDTGTDLIDTQLRVMTWNLWWRFGPWEARIPAIEATLAQVDADIAALQEVWQEDGVDFAGLLADKLGFAHAYHAHNVRDGVAFGNAILSRWPIERREVRALPAVEGRDEKRLALGVDVAGPRGRVRVFSTHLNWRAHDSGIRQQQVAELARFAADMGPSEFAPIVCGDFNAGPASDEIRMLTGETTCPVDGLVFRDAWRQAGDGSPGYTWDNANPYAGATLEPDGRIDYIFTSEPRDRGAGHVTRCMVCANEPIDGVWPSDHFAVMAELRY